MTKRQRGVVIVLVAVLLIGGCLGTNALRQHDAQEAVDRARHEIERRLHDAELDVGAMHESYAVRDTEDLEQVDSIEQMEEFEPLVVDSADLERVTFGDGGLRAEYRVASGGLHRCLGAVVTSDGELASLSRIDC